MAGVTSGASTGPIYSPALPNVHGSCAAQLPASPARGSAARQHNTLQHGQLPSSTATACMSCTARTPRAPYALTSTLARMHWAPAPPLEAPDPPRPAPLPVEMAAQAQGFFSSESWNWRK